MLIAAAMTAILFMPPPKPEVLDSNACTPVEISDQTAKLMENFFDQGDYRTLVNLNLYFAERGDPNAMWAVGLFLASGTKLPEMSEEGRIKQAIYWIERSANCGHDIAQEEYAKMLQDGEPTLNLKPSPEIAECLQGRVGEKDSLKSCRATFAS